MSMPVPPPPTWRKPVGILALLAGLMLYAGLAMQAAGWIGGWPAWAQALIYAVLGVVWLLPLRRYLIWMETGRWG